MHKNTRRRVSHASGYIGLGMLKAASAELAAIAIEDHFEPEVLGARVDLSMEAKDWNQVVIVARALSARAPENERGWIAWAYALRELQQVEAAKAVLLQAEPLCGATSAVLHYNLACYYCLLGDLVTARHYLAHACTLHPDFERQAADDPDLHALKNELV